MTVRDFVCVAKVKLGLLGHPQVTYMYSFMSRRTICFIGKATTYFAD